MNEPKKREKKKIENAMSDKILKFLYKHNISYNKKLEENKNNAAKCRMRMLALMNYLNKVIAPQKRNVYFSKKLQFKIENEFGCDLNASIFLFKGLLEEGENINKYLSKKAFKSNDLDLLLNMWNIMHFHLPNQTEYLLFCIIENNDVYVIDVILHPHAEEFFEYHFLETIYDNGWITHIAHEMKDVVNVSVEIKNKQDLYQLYKHGINYNMFMFEGKCYMIKLGIMNNGESVKNVMIYNKIMNYINQLIITQNAQFLNFMLSDNGHYGNLLLIQNGMVYEHTLHFC